jgi:hypothetical protein
MRIGFARPVVSILLLAALIPFAVFYFGTDNIVDSLKKFSPATAGLLFGALLINGLVAAYRFKVVAGATGHKVAFREAMAAVAAGSLGGVLFFQLAGQLMARGFVMRRGPMPFAAIVAVTLYERITAAALSGVLALAGALYIFGRVYLDPQAGGLILIKIVCGLIAAAGAGAVFGYGNLARRALASFLTTALLYRSLLFVALTLLVQLPTMAAYVLAAHALSPQSDIGDLAAASAIVMFAASVPISFAGWGVRELSAIVALGAVGVAGPDALTAAVVIGAGSMLAMGMIFALGAAASGRDHAPEAQQTGGAVDYARALAWCLPITAAICVLFQIHIPVGSNQLNVNLADPIAMLAGALFVLHAITQRQWPQWRVGSLNLSVAIATAVLGFSLLLGAWRFGWTDWALINRFLGWFVLLAFGATGALIAAACGRDGVRIMLLTYMAATAGVALIELALVLLDALGLDVPARILEPGNLKGFAQNRNSFAFQLLMAVSAGLVLLQGRKARLLLFTAMLVAFWYAGSRSGWIAIACVLVAGIALRATTIKEVSTVLVCSSLCIAVIAAVWILRTSMAAEALSGTGQFWPSGGSTDERLLTIAGGWKLFLENPLFGAGLGAFNQLTLSTEGKPLVIHSTALWLLAELGITGFVVFAGPAAYVWAAEWSSARGAPHAAITALCFVALAVMSAPADMLYQRPFWLLIGATLALPKQWPK